MKRGLLLAALCLTTLSLGSPLLIQAQPNAGAQWIWFDEPKPAQDASARTRYFRRVFKIDRPIQNPVDEGTLDITAADSFVVWVNGVKVGEGSDWRRNHRFDVTRLLVHGDNVLAVQASNAKVQAGLIVRLAYVPNGMSRMALVSDQNWKSSRDAAPGWEQVKFDDRSWSPARVLGPYGRTQPWEAFRWGEGGGDGRFTVPAGFAVENVVPASTVVNGRRISLVNMTFDNLGRLLVSQEGGPVLLCTDPDSRGVMQSISTYCTQVRNCQGMCWVKDSLLLMGEGPQGTGLYRVRDTGGTGKTDEATLLLPYKGGMGEHGPHAILHGPDGWIYVVNGNHSWAQVAELANNSPIRRWPTGNMGPDQGRPGTTEDVLLPRLNDARGHAANILAPGGTIWRLDHDGRNMSLVAAGFRNEFDAAFTPDGELWTFDSDMEWDENLPWYRPVRVCHCPPGADFAWRTGSANTPNYYIDSLPPTYETGRGSPVGLVGYDHPAFPARYRGCVFMADWSLGIIHAVFPQKKGASYQAKVERFCVGAPMNVTDLEVGPDGALYFTLGGRGSEGGVYRIFSTGSQSEAPSDSYDPRVQPLSAWSRARFDRLRDAIRVENVANAFASAALDFSVPVRDRIAMLTALQIHDMNIDPMTLLRLARDRQADVRAHAVWLLGVRGIRTAKGALLDALKDDDLFVRRRACEALIRAEIEPPVAAIWPLLASEDRFLRTAARLVLQRIGPAQWADRLWDERNDFVAWEGIIALCKMKRATEYAERLYDRLRAIPRSAGDVAPMLNYLRTLQIALIHVPGKTAAVKAIAQRVDLLFPQKNNSVNRELAILLTEFQREGLLKQPIQSRLLNALLASDYRQQQIHYFYCLRLLKDGWTTQDKFSLAHWYNTTRTWSGGHSFTPFLENIFRETLGAYSLADRRRLLQGALDTPLPALILLQRMQTEAQPDLFPALTSLSKQLAAQQPTAVFRGGELRQAVDGAVLRTALNHPSSGNWGVLVQGLSSPNPILRSDSIRALRKVPDRPKADDPTPFRSLLVSAQKLSSTKEKWQAIELARQWTGRSFGADEDDWKTELRMWNRWFAQSFPKEPALPNAEVEKLPTSKYPFAELLSYLENDSRGKSGDVVRGRVIFEKALCIKCHKYGNDGEGVGPDLTTLSKRFKRSDTLDSILFPSKVISDQYRSSLITTTKGQQLNGLASVQGDTVTVLINDGSKVSLKKDEIESQTASLISVMPERLLDTLSREEIADLFAFLESTPKS
jgi:putative heme-binding domain-containing protein